MNNHTFTEYLYRETAGLSPRAVIERLVEMEVISSSRCEQYAIRSEVERLVRNGVGCCNAMEDTAIRFCCSYAKVRQAVYYKPKK